MERGHFMQTTAWLVSRELTDAAGRDTRLQEDGDSEYFSRVVLASSGVKFVPEAKAFWRNTGMRGLSYIGTSREKVDAHFLSMRLQISNLRALEDSERVRTACLRYLQNFMIYVYPERPDLFEQAQEIAQELGGRVEAPVLSWKYAYFQKAFGWGAAKQLRFLLPNLKRGFNIWWDKQMFCLGNRNGQVQAGPNPAALPAEEESIRK